MLCQRGRSSRPLLWGGRTRLRMDGCGQLGRGNDLVQRCLREETATAVGDFSGKTNCELETSRAIASQNAAIDVR